MATDRWRETYDQWKLATPPEHEGGDEMDEWEEYWIAIDREEEEGIRLVREKLS